ncbi:MAG: GTPase ObgE [bacterium]
MARPFIDEVQLTACGGDGGDGCTSFESQPYQPHGGPDGGNGGPGGDVIIKASNSLTTLAEFNHQENLQAENGKPGGPGNKKGAAGDDKVIEVPVGTVIYNNNTGEKIADLTEANDTKIVAQGGDGGRGNSSFASSKRQKPRFHEFGEAGEKVPLRMELKLLAEVGLVGLPNAGKSTLLASITGAHPEIASHPFTTKKPNLGVLFHNHKRLTICDIPGLIEEAHRGAGLGIQFLKHIDRTELLLHIIDISGTTPLQDYKIIRKELEAYNPGLLNKPTLIAVNKIDLVEEELVDLFVEEISPAPGPVIPVSAREGQNLEQLEDKIWEQYELSQKESEAKSENRSERVVRMEQKDPIKVQKKGDRFLLSGDRVVNLLERFDLTNPDALSYVRMRLLEMGLHKKLEKAGCKPGDTVQVGRQEFNYTG